MGRWPTAPIPRASPHGARHELPDRRPRPAHRRRTTRPRQRASTRRLERRAPGDSRRAARPARRGRRRGSWRRDVNEYDPADAGADRLIFLADALKLVPFSETTLRSAISKGELEAWQPNADGKLIMWRSTLIAWAT